jgi:hypothetical protein
VHADAEKALRPAFFALMFFGYLAKMQKNTKMSYIHSFNDEKIF